MADLTGQTLGKYQIVERLGRGGMADVFKAYQPGLERYVAVKVLHPHLAEDADFITRFKREAKAVASLRHPNIVQVFDFDASGNNYFMVMEFIEGGRTLKEVLQEAAARDQRLPVTECIDIISKVADALDYAHRQGMVHRDIKPSNVLVASLDHPVLSDFGIARIVGQTGLTGTGAMVGTPAYMSPEQGRGEPADERADIYALGIMLYELLTGKPPFDADTPYAIILKHINDPIPSPRALVADLPPELEPIVLKSLAKDKNDRFASAGKLRDALRQASARLGAVTTVGDTTEMMAPAAVDTVSVPRPVNAPPSPAKRGFPIWLPIVGIAVVLAAVAAAASGLFTVPTSSPPTTGGPTGAPPELERSVVVRISPTCPAPPVNSGDNVYARVGWATDSISNAENAAEHLSFVVTLDGTELGEIEAIQSPTQSAGNDQFGCAAGIVAPAYTIYFDLPLGHLEPGTHSVSVEFILDEAVPDAATMAGPGPVGNIEKTFEVSP